MLDFTYSIKYNWKKRRKSYGSNSVIAIMEFFLFSEDQSQPINLLSLFLHTDRRVDAGGIDTGVSQNICQSDDIFGRFVELACKQMPKIMREHFSGFHMCHITKPLHRFQNITPMNRLSVSCDKHTACRKLSLDHIGFQFLSQLLRNQHFPMLSL